MAKSTIIVRLRSKQIELEDDAEYQNEQAEALRARIEAHEVAAVRSYAQAAATEKALGILIEAGVTF